jgi:hypothetical protein
VALIRNTCAVIGTLYLLDSAFQSVSAWNLNAVTVMNLTTRGEDSMPQHDPRGVAGSGLDEVQGAIVLATFTFVLGLVTGLFLKGLGKQGSAPTRLSLWRRGSERTVTYDENLPDSLSRREPAPHAGQPRFGGTGAIGVSPSSVIAARREEQPER